MKDVKICPTCAGGGRQRAQDGGFKVTTICRTCNGECFLPTDHPVFEGGPIEPPRPGEQLKLPLDLRP